MPTAEDWHGARVLVTGATGFIGSHLVRRLAQLGAQVHATSRRPYQPTTTHPAAAAGRDTATTTPAVAARSAQDAASTPRTADAPPTASAPPTADAPPTASAPPTVDGRVTWHVVDLRDAEGTAELVRSVRPDVVFHLASEVTGARDVKLVLPVMHANLTAAVNLLAAVADGPTARVVLAGSIEEPRDADPIPSSPYAVAKWAATGYARLFHALWGARVTVLRVAMVYGPGQPDTTKLVPYAALSLLRGHEPRLSSGTRLIDWVYVDDVVDAFVRAGTAERAAGHAIDIGSGTAVSIRDTIDLLAEVAGGALRPRYGAIADRPLDAARIADPGPAADLLGWRPVTGLEDGLRQTVRWYADHPA